METQQENKSIIDKSELIDASVLREISKKNMEKQNNNNNEMRYKKALNEAFEKVIEGANKKIIDAADKGYLRAYLYFFHYVNLNENPDEKHKFRFQGCRIMDIIKKGNLIEKLNNYFNKDNETEFIVGMRVFPNRTPRSYGIYIDWRPKSERKQYSNEEVNDDSEKNQMTYRSKSSRSFEKDSSSNSKNNKTKIYDSPTPSQSLGSKNSNNNSTTKSKEDVTSNKKESSSLNKKDNISSKMKETTSLNIKV